MDMPRLDLAKGANIAQIVSLIPGTYCAYGTWVLLHQPTSTPTVQPTAPPLLLASFLVFAATVLTGIILRFVSSRQKHSGITIDSAKWYCTRVASAHRNVTRDIQGMVHENGLLIHAHDNVFGDICKNHEGSGDPKTLEIDLTYHLHLTAPHDGWINLCAPQIGAPHSGATPPVPIRNNQELNQRIDKLQSDLMKANNSADGWLKETQAKALELQGERAKLQNSQSVVLKQQDAIKLLESDTYHNFWKWIGTVLDLADEADKLNAMLEGVWHLWNNQGEKLIHPLHGGSISEAPAPLPWNQRQLLEFRILYRHHIIDVQTIDPNFQSNLIIEGFPCDGPGQEYLHVRRKIEAHAGLLREHAARHIREFSASHQTQ